MARSVSYLTRADAVAYDHLEFENDEIFDELTWRDYKEFMIEKLKNKFPSLQDTDSWEDETQIILENEFCEIGLSEYCGLISISIRAKDEYDNYPGLAEAWVDKVKSKFLSIGTLIKQGTFSNGESVYRRKAQ